MKIPKMFIHFGRRRRPSASPLAAQGNAVRFSSVKNKSSVASSGATFRKNREKNKWGSFVHRNQKKITEFHQNARQPRIFHNSMAKKYKLDQIELERSAT